MKTSQLSRAITLFLTGLFAVALVACGGSESDSNAATASSTPAPATSADPATAETSAVAAAVVAPELVRNSDFSDGLTAWTVNNAALMDSQVRTGGKALNIGTQAKQVFANATLQPKTSYKLVVRARNIGAGNTSHAALSFRIPATNEAFRTYKIDITGSTYQDYRIDFTAPAYAAIADIILTAGNAHLIVDSLTLKARTGIDPTEAIASTEGSYVPAGYKLVFNDEFSGTALDRSKWATRYIYSSETTDRLNDEKQHYRDNDNHVVANGVLNLTARKVSSTDPAGINYESGMIRSLWTGLYGYYEARVKMPGGLGVWPAFWLNSDASPAGRLEWPPEIDIFEFVNNGVEDKINMLHSNVVTPAGASYPLTYSDAAFNTNWNFYKAPFNFNEDWHTVAAEWTPTGMTMLIDGKKIYTRSYAWSYKDGTLGGPAHILLNLAIGGQWAGRHGIDDSAFPQALQVDWVRAYQKTN